MRVFDVRSLSKIVEVPSHPNMKSARLVWSNEKSWVISCGYGKQSSR
jgi:hypothetical protein